MNRLISRGFWAVLGALLFRVPFWLIAWRALPTLCNWDCGIYSYISKNYVAADSAFFPLFPLWVHSIGTLFPRLSAESAVVVASNLFVPLAGALFLFLCDSLWHDPARERVFGFYRKSWFALLLLSIFPEGHFWMRGYSEPVFFTLLMGILLALGARRWVWVGICAGLIAVTRPQGVWVDAIVGPLLLWRLFAGSRPRDWRLGAAILACLVPFLGFMFWLWRETGNPIYFYVAQQGWGRHFDLWAGFRDQLPRWDASHLYLYLGVWAGIRFCRRPGVDWRMIGVLSLVFSELPIFFGGFFSYVRFASINPAIFLLVSEVISGIAVAWAMGGVGLAVVVWCLVRLAVQVQMAASTWVG